MTPGKALKLSRATSVEEIPIKKRELCSSPAMKEDRAPVKLCLRDQKSSRKKGSARAHARKKVSLESEYLQRESEA